MCAMMSSPLTVSLVRVSRLATSKVLFSKSRCPTAKRTGTPFSSYS